MLKGRKEGRNVEVVEVNDVFEVVEVLEVDEVDSVIDERPKGPIEKRKRN